MMNDFYTRRCIQGLAEVHGREHAIIEDMRMYESNHMFNT
jgi:hypothetical protein